jgi:hypothetical protein
MLKNEYIIGAGFIDRFAVEKKAAAGGGLKSSENANEGRFPATGGAENTNKFAVGKIQGYVVENQTSAIARRLIDGPGAEASIEVFFTEVINDDMSHIMTFASPTPKTRSEPIFGRRNQGQFR